MMAKQRDDQKRLAWEQRLARFRTSGATIAKFCERENVSVHTFHYWAKRLRAVVAEQKSLTPRAASERPTATKSVVRVGITDKDSTRIHVGWGAHAQISIPADALEALACVLDWLHDSRGHRSLGQRDQTSEAFQQLIVATRGKARA